MTERRSGGGSSAGSATATEISSFAGEEHSDFVVNLRRQAAGRRSPLLTQQRHGGGGGGADDTPWRIPASISLAPQAGYVLRPCLTSELLCPSKDMCPETRGPSQCRVVTPAGLLRGGAGRGEHHTPHQQGRWSAQQRLTLVLHIRREKKHAADVSRSSAATRAMRSVAGASELCTVKNVTNQTLKPAPLSERAGDDIGAAADAGCRLGLEWSRAEVV